MLGRAGTRYLLPPMVSIPWETFLIGAGLLLLILVVCLVIAWHMEEDESWLEKSRREYLKRKYKI